MIANVTQHLTIDVPNCEDSTSQLNPDCLAH